VIRVVVADDQRLIRRALVALLERAGDIEVVAEADDGLSAVAAARRHAPDVVLMDVRMPGMDGIEATRSIRNELAGTEVVVLTTYDLDEYVFAAVRAGAAGFLLKDGDGDDLAAAIRACASGESTVSPQSLRRLLDEFARAPVPDRSAVGAVARLTDRERAVLVEIAHGFSNDEIAESLHLGVSTVKTHVGSLLAKLGARDRTQAAIAAYRSGLVDADPGGR
jgi:DNA-binding NarL/FixJ family response regulator